MARFVLGRGVAPEDPQVSAMAPQVPPISTKTLAEIPEVEVALFRSNRAQSRSRPSLIEITPSFVKPPLDLINILAAMVEHYDRFGRAFVPERVAV